MHLIKWFESFFKALTFNDKFNGFHVYDMIFLLFLLIGMIYGIRKGFLRAMMEFLQFLVVMFFTLDNYEWLAQWLMTTSHKIKIPESLALTVSYFFVMSVVWAAIIVLDTTFRKWIQSKTQPALRATGGAFFGIAYFFFVFALISTGLSLVPQPDLHQIFILGSSRFGPSLSTAAPELYQIASLKLGALLAAK